MAIPPHLMNPLARLTRAGQGNPQQRPQMRPQQARPQFSPGDAMRARAKRGQAPDPSACG